MFLTAVSERDRQRHRESGETEKDRGRKCKREKRKSGMDRHTENTRDKLPENKTKKASVPLTHIETGKIQLTLLHLSLQH